MDSEDALEQQGSETKEPAAPPEPAAKPNQVTREEFNQQQERLLSSIHQTNERLADILERISQPQPQPQPQLPPDEEPGEDDDVPTVVRKVVAKSLKPLSQRLDQISAVGLGTMEKLSQRQVIPTLKHYKRFEREIGQVLQGTDVALRAQPETIQMAYDVVLARHHDELVREEVDAALRRETKGETQTGRPGGRQEGSLTGEAGGLKAEDFLSPGQLDAIEERGGRDAWARRMSGGRYKDFQAYLEAHAKMNQRRAQT